MNERCCCKVDFVIEDSPDILFEVDGGEALDLELADPIIRTGVYPVYDGPIAVVSRIGEEQTLDTGMTSVMEDITVGRIPVTETSNPYGGNTVVIG